MQYKVPVKTEVLVAEPERKLMPIDEAMEVLLNGHVTVDGIRGLLSCIKFEDDRPDFESQVGMTPDEFQQRYGDLLETQKSKDVEELVYLVSYAANKYNICAEQIMNSVNIYGRTLSDIIAKGGKL